MYNEFIFNTPEKSNHREDQPTISDDRIKKYDYSNIDYLRYSGEGKEVVL